jgi:hypothetical protein
LCSKRDLVNRILLKVSLRKQWDAVSDACLGMVVRFLQDNLCEET